MNNISLIIVDNLQHDLARFSIEETLKHINAKEIILFSDRNFFPESKFVNIKKSISVFDYSDIILKHLWLYLETDYALIIQWDGMAIDKNYWTSDFYKYDYIGAPWNDQPGYNIGNGGFSFRSKKLIHALRDTKITLGQQSGELEDIAICKEFRNYLEETYDIKYAPYNVAKNFSFELDFTNNTFGFHGIWNIGRFFTYNQLEYIIENIPNHIWKTSWKVNRLLQVLQDNNFHSLIDKCKEKYANL